MKAIVGKEIRVIEPTSDFRKKVESDLTVSNPDFARLKKMGKWTGGTPSTIRFYRTEGKDIILPFGCLREYVFKNIKDVEADFEQTENVIYTQYVPLYEYQDKAVEEALAKRNGILVAPCGSGKTQIGLALIKKTGGKALWLTHTSKLLKQSKEARIKALK